MVLSISSLVVIIITEILYYITRKKSSRRSIKLELQGSSIIENPNIISFILSFLGILFAISVEWASLNKLIVSQIQLSISIFAPLLVFAGIFLDWLEKSYSALFNLPHNRLLNTLLDQPEDELGVVSTRYGEYIDGISSHINSLEKINSQYRKTITDLVTLSHHKNVTTQTLDLNGIDARNTKRPISCIKIHVSSSGYYRFLKNFCKKFGTDGDLYKIRVLSTFQPYEWFHTPQGKGEVTFYEEILDMMEIYADTFEHYDHFTRYIPSKKSMVDTQRDLQIIYEEDETKPLHKGAIEKIGESNLYFSTFPFDNTAKRDEEPLRFFVISEEDNLSNDEYKSCSLLDAFCFGETYLIDERSSICSLKGEKENLDKRSEDLTNGNKIEYLWSPVKEMLVKYRINDFDEMFFIKDKNNDESDSFIFGLFVNVRVGVPSTISILVDQGELKAFNSLFDQLDDSVSQISCFGNEGESGDNGITRIGGECSKP